MGKFYAFLGILTASAAMILALLTALTSASASLTNAEANLASSTALLTSQCMTGFLVIVSLGAGGVFGFGLGLLRSKSLTAPTAQLRRVSHVRRQRRNPLTQLPSPQKHFAERQAALLAIDAEEEDNLSLQGWGF